MDPHTASEVETVMSNFNQIVYTPFNEAVSELTKRWENKVLETKVTEILKGGIPKVLEDGFKTVLFRQLASPNYELRRFLSVGDALGWKTIFWEYYDDKFTSNNPCKYYLGKMGFYSGLGKKGGAKMEYINIIDFNKCNGEKISNIHTLWGQSLIDFHHELFFDRFPYDTNSIFFDASSWFSTNGQNAKQYYKNYLLLFLRNALLFENFLLEDKQELNFTKEVFIPAFLEVWKETGFKPLIVPLEPTSSEGEEFWYCYPSNMKDSINDKLNAVNQK